MPKFILTLVLISYTASGAGVALPPSVQRLISKPSHIPTTLEEVTKTIVRLEGLQSQGTAEFIGANILLSAAHVCVTMPEIGKRREIKIDAPALMVLGEEVKVIAVDVDRDLCLLKTTKTMSKKWLSLAQDSERQVLEPAISIGYAFGTFYISQAGLVYADVNPQFNLYTHNSSVGPVGPGMSGGPLISAKSGKMIGMVIGTINAPHPAVNGMGLFILASEIRKFLQEQNIQLP